MRFPGFTLFFPTLATFESIMAIICAGPAFVTLIEITRFDLVALALTETEVAGLALALTEGLGVGVGVGVGFTVGVAVSN